MSMSASAKRLVAMLLWFGACVFVLLLTLGDPAVGEAQIGLAIWMNFLTFPFGMIVAVLSRVLLASKFPSRSSSS